jgi:hypothetical protein
MSNAQFFTALCLPLVVILVGFYFQNTGIRDLRSDIPYQQGSGHLQSPHPGRRAAQALTTLYYAGLFMNPATASGNSDLRRCAKS